MWAPFLPLVALFYVGATFASAVRYWRGKGGQWKARVQAPVQERFRVVIEIDVRGEALPIAIFVRAAADVIFIVEQVGNTGHFRHIAEKLRCLQESVEFAIGRRQVAHAHAHCLAADFSHFIECETVIEAWEIVEDALAEGRIEEIINDDVAKQTRILELSGVVVVRIQCARGDQRHVW